MASSLHRTAPEVDSGSQPVTCAHRPSSVTAPDAPPPPAVPSSVAAAGAATSEPGNGECCASPDSLEPTNLFTDAAGDVSYATAGGAGRTGKVLRFIRYLTQLELTRMTDTDVYLNLTATLTKDEARRLVGAIRACELALVQLTPSRPSDSSRGRLARGPQEASLAVSSPLPTQQTPAVGFAAQEAPEDGEDL